MNLVIDAHQDLAFSMLSFKRDYTTSARAIREKEVGTLFPSYNGDTLLGWEDYQAGNVAVIFSTLFAPPIRRQAGAWETQVYRHTAEARSLYQAQLDAYLRLCDAHPQKFTLIQSKTGLQAHISQWQVKLSSPKPESVQPPVGLVLLMEGAEAIAHPDELEGWYQAGLRIIGPAWAGTCFCGGTKEPGGLTKAGFELLEAMSALGFVLDISHMDEKAAQQALDVYAGQVIASHANAQALLRADTNRHLTDRTIALLIERKGIIGAIPYNRFLKADWMPQDGRACVTLADFVAHIDHICQIAGNCNHAGFGTDFDGGFGLQSVPAEIDTIAELHKIVPLLAEKGYSPADIGAIFGGNWLNMLEYTLK